MQRANLLLLVGAAIMFAAIVYAFLVGDFFGESFYVVTASPEKDALDDSDVPPEAKVILPDEFPIQKLRRDVDILGGTGGHTSYEGHQLYMNLVRSMYSEYTQSRRAKS